MPAIQVKTKSGKTLTIQESSLPVYEARGCTRVTKEAPMPAAPPPATSTSKKES